VEFALVLPFLVLLMFGLIEFGRAYSAKIELTAAVREGARAAALAEGVCGTADVTTCVRDSTRDAAGGLDSGSITVTPTLCTSVPKPVNATVAAQYPFTYDIPFFGSGTWTLNAKGVMRCGG
jgi:Flp pilus assembly protein TadG